MVTVRIDFSLGMTARFHYHLAESLLHFGYMKTKHDHNLWMISHYAC
jgi:hypothetical protein